MKPTIIKHAVAQSLLTRSRNKDTSCPKFARNIRDLGYYLAVYATAELGSEPTTVMTPLEMRYNGCRITEKIALVPIMRAGEGLLHGFLDLLPESLT
jgi:uracil phosphoribosyltransferase